MNTYKSNLEKISLVKEKTDFKRVKVTSSKDAKDVIKQFYFDDIEIFESMFILLLNRSNNTIGYAKISQGGTAGTVVDIKIVAKYALESLASSVILAHNHPSGRLEASNADMKITEKIKKGLEIFDIRLLDHLILTRDSYFSFADRDIL